MVFTIFIPPLIRSPLFTIHIRVLLMVLNDRSNILSNERIHCYHKTSEDLPFMSLTIDKKILALKNTAVGRCRERIELAASKAESSSAITYHDQPGITSILKGKRGL